MNILNISTFDNDGAGKAAYRIHKNFINNGVNSKLLVLSKSIYNSNVIQVRQNIIFRIIKRVISFFIKEQKTDSEYYFFNNNENRTNVRFKDIENSLPFTPDIIIVHWVSRFLNAKSIYKLHKLTKAPIYWVLMDMSPLTGGCHYTWNCNGYTKSCGNCPALFSEKENDLSFRNLHLKAKYLNKIDLTIVAGTTQLIKQSQRSSLFSNKKIIHIPLGINKEIFKPIPKNYARTILNLPKDSKIIFVGSSNMKEKRKGVNYFIDSLSILSEKLKNDNNSIIDKTLILLAGNNINVSSFNDLPFKFETLGFFHDDISLALAYQAADVFVSPSIEESGPMMVYEAIMTGTPVVSFNIGIARDIVIHGQTGYLAEIMNTQELAKGIYKLLTLSDDNYNNISMNCRIIGVSTSSPDVQINKFKTAFTN